jgi:pimeloyl-ACP methyl ester carboxylesterase
MGGMIASHFTSKHPELVEKLILIGPAIAPVPLPLIARFQNHVYYLSTNNF